MDRVGHLRKDKEWLAKALNDPTTLIVPFWQQKPFVLPGEPTDIGWIRPGLIKIEREVERGAVLLFLGQYEGAAHFAIDVSRMRDPENSGPLAGFGMFEDLRPLAMRAKNEEVAILAQAKALFHWHETHLFCGKCGDKTEIKDAGHVRHCSGCGTDHFPRTDPVVIMLAVRGEKALIGRGKVFRAGSYSALAGFVEHGETIEEAVRREVYEETAVRVGDVRYVTSQPWPFPLSLMIGCIGEAETEEITIDTTEIQEAIWVTRVQLQKALNGDADKDFDVPGPIAIAHHIMKAWAFDNA